MALVVARLVAKLTLDDKQYQKRLKMLPRSLAIVEKRVAKTGKQIDTATKKISKPLEKTAKVIDTSFSSSLKNLGSNVNRSLGKAEALFKGFLSTVVKGGAIIGGVVAGITAGIGIVAAAIFKLGDNAKQVPVIAASFKALANDFEGGSTAMLAALQKSSAGMIANTELMQKFNLAALLVSKDFATRLPGALERLSKISLATGEDLDFLLSSFIRATGRLSPLILDNITVVIDAEQAYADYAKTIGKTTEQLTKQEQQTAFAEASLAQLEEKVGVLPSVQGTAIQAFAAFRASMQNTADAVGTDFLPAISRLLDTARSLLPIIQRIGQAFAGIFSASIEIASRLIFGFAEGLGLDMDNLADNMATWGSNIIVQFAQGMATAMNLVLQQLLNLGKLISSLLKPGSPPKLLPDIDKWGTGTINAWLEGMTKANVGILRTLSGKVESFLRSVMPDISDIDFADMILDIREGLEGALAGTGNVLAVLPEGMRNYAAALLEASAAAEETKRAQENLNAVQARFEDILKPLNAEMREIQKRRQEIIDQQRRAVLEAIISDANAPALAKELAQMELREIELNNQIATTEEARDLAVDAAQEQLDAAQAAQQAAEDRLRIEEQLLQHQIEANNLLNVTNETLKTQKGLVESLTESLEQGAGGMLNFGDSISDFADEIIEQFSGTFDLAGQVGEVWGDNFAIIQEKGEELMTWWSKNFGEDGRFRVLTQDSTKFFGKMFGDNGLFNSLVDQATKILRDAWDRGGTWEVMQQANAVVVELAKSAWESVFGDNGSWRTIIDSATAHLAGVWGEDGVWAGLMTTLGGVMGTFLGDIVQLIIDIENQINSAIAFVNILIDTINNIPGVDLPNIPGLPDVPGNNRQTPTPPSRGGSKGFASSDVRGGGLVIETININNGMDLAQLLALIRRTVREDVG